MSLSRCSLHHLAHVDFSTSKFRDRNKFRLQFWQHRKYWYIVICLCTKVTFLLRTMQVKKHFFSFLGVDLIILRVLTRNESPKFVLVKQTLN